MGLTLSSSSSSSTWQVQEAKSRFSELLERAATEGPQTITRHGKPVARVVPLDARGNYAAPLSQSADADVGADDNYKGMSFGEFLLSAPKIEGGLPEMPRDRSPGRPPMFGEE